MSLSIAKATPRNIESVRTKDLIPSSIQLSAKNLVTLLEYYYDYLNTAGLPTNEIASISSLKDIDAVSMKYIDQIEELIGKNVPSSQVLNRIELYKIIVKYYNTRGSEDSVHTFFKIFFNQIVEIVYPKERLFNLSGGGGAWSSVKLIEDSGETPFIRNISDESTLTLAGITFDAIVTDGGGQLISVAINEWAEDQYNIGIGYDNGIITVTPGASSHIGVDAVDLSNGTTTWPIPSDLYYVGMLNDKPKFSERIDNVTPWVGTPSRIEWTGTQWRFYIGSATGDAFAFYSLEDVADPVLVTSWSNGWEPEAGVLTGSITNLTFVGPVNAQIFDAMLNNSDIAENLIISADVLSADWLDTIAIADREYLTTFDLPTDVEPGHLAVVNGMTTHPFVVGVASEFDGNIVWERAAPDEWVYTDHKSFVSDDFKLFDGHYWQDYSYVIRSDLDSSVWYDDYLKFVHPAGLRMFSAIVIEMAALNKWDHYMSYESTDINTDDSWMMSLIPPHILDARSIGFHSPKYQPGFLRDKLLKYIFTYLFDSTADQGLVRLVLLTIKTLTGPTDVRSSLVRRQYLVSEKFVDPCEIGAGMLSKVIGEADEEFSITNRARFLNLSAFINSPNIWDYAYYDEEEGDGSGVWDSSSYDEDGGDGSPPFDGSSYEDL
jgi:hypothetical protein